jgi:hypothetical protein
LAAGSGVSLAHFIFAFLIMVHDFDASWNHPRAVKVFESWHRPSEAFDGPMVLLDHVVQYLT